MYGKLVKELKDSAEWADHLALLMGRADGDTLAPIMRQAADSIEELCGLCASQSKDCSEAVAKYLELWAKQPCWIPVTERLPECDLGAEVGNIEWISYGRVYAGCFGRGGKYRDAYFRTWTDAGEGIDAKEADYWRAVTLPEPPKEET